MSLNEEQRRQIPVHLVSAARRTANVNFPYTRAAHTFPLVVTLLLIAGILQMPAQMRILPPGANDVLEWVNPQASSNSSYRVETTTSLNGPWRVPAESLACINTSSNYVSAPIPPRLNATNSALFYRVALNEFMVGPPADTNFALLAVHANGERILTTKDLTKIVYTSTNGSSATIYLGTNGLPEKLVDNGVVFLFSNYRSNLVDLALVTSNGVEHLQRDIPLPVLSSSQAAKVARISATLGKSAPKDAAEDDQNFHNIVDYTMLGLSIGACAISLCTAPAGITIPVIIAACAGALVDVLAAYTDDPDFAASSHVIGLFSCVTLPVRPLGLGDCLQEIAALAQDTMFKDDQTLSQYLDTITAALALLAGQSPIVSGHWSLAPFTGTVGFYIADDKTIYAVAPVFCDPTNVPCTLNGTKLEWSVTRTNVSWTYDNSYRIVTPTTLVGTSTVTTLQTNVHTFQGTIRFVGYW